MVEMIYAVDADIKSVAFVGWCCVEADEDEFFGGPDSQPYRSRGLNNPTWEVLMKCAKAQAKKTLDEHHVFVEGYEVVAQHGNVTSIRLLLGS